MKHYATATWTGSGLKGGGTVTIQSNAFGGVSYSFDSRFKNEPGTKPEELLAAAHASDFTMKLSFILADAGFAPEYLSTTCTVDFERGQISASRLLVSATIQHIDQATLNKCIMVAMATCPLSVALNEKINIEAKIEKIIEN
ncbi:MAG: OsmC family protein [Mucilaginibacter sp.]|jgi:osmotically inducible protein OsmC|nr:OsmC family protein [Mucilaginibacter sp.]